MLTNDLHVAWLATTQAAGEMSSLRARCDEAAEAAARAEAEAAQLRNEVEAGGVLAAQLQRRIQCMCGQVRDSRGPHHPT